MPIQDKEMWLRLATELEFDDEQRARMVKNVAEWDKKLEPALRGIDRCRIITAHDMNTVVNT